MPSPRIANLETGYKLLEMRQELFKQDVAQLATRLVNGELTAVQWREEMRQQLKMLHGTSLAISKGGWQNVSFAEWGRLGGNIKGQYNYLTRFAKQIEERANLALMQKGNFYGENYLKTRAGLYANNARATFWRGVTYGELPQVPGDGQTLCKMNCGCVLQIEPGDAPDIVNVYWVVNPALENCADCLHLQAEWKPLMVQIPGEMVEAADKIGIDIQGTIINVLRADAEWYVERLHAIAHGHATKVYA